jgi:hypothetical protein
VSRPPVGIRALRIAALPVIAGGLGIHLWLGTKVGLAVAAAGLAAHLAVAHLGRRWLLRRDRPLP